MPVLASLTTFVSGQVATAASMNGNWSALRTWADNSVVMTDVAKTISVTHTFSAAQIFSGGISGALSCTSTLATADAITITNAFPKIVFVESDQAADNKRWYFGIDSKILYGRITNDADNSAADWLTVTRGSGVAISSVAVTAPFQVTTGGITVTAGGAAITGNSTVTGNLTVTGSLSAPGFIVMDRLTSDESTTSATPADTALSITIAANEVWRVDFDLGINCNNTGGVILNFTGPAGSTSRVNWHGATSSHTAIYSRTTAGLSSVQTWSTFNSAADSDGVQVRASVYLANGATPGSLTLQLASFTGGQTSKVLTGSTALAARIV